MARPFKVGNDYFNIDCDISDNYKIEALESIHKLKGFGIWIKLLEKIYRSGYYVKWDEMTAGVFAYKKIGEPVEFLNKVIETCFSVNLLDRHLFQSYGILTSHGIQERYLRMVNGRKKVELISEYILIDVFEFITTENLKITPIITGLTPINFELSDDNSEDNTLKEKKGNRKEKEKEPSQNKSAGNSKIDFIDQLLNIFLDEYKNSRGDEFVLNNPGKERRAIGSLLAWYKKKNKEANKSSDDTLEDFRALFKAAMTIKDKWHRDNMSPSHVNSRLHEIRNKLKYETSYSIGEDSDTEKYRRLLESEPD